MPFESSAGAPPGAALSQMPKNLKNKLFKIVRIILYGFVVATGLAGLLAGGVPLVKFALQYWHDHQYSYYYDTNSLYLPEVVVLLSLTLLVFVHISFMLGKKNQVAQTKPDSANATAANATTPSEENFRRDASIGTKAKSEIETADEKLSRLLRQKND